jgi:hypothetical protein
MSPLFNHLFDPKTTALVHDLLTDRLATELTFAWSDLLPTHATQVEDLHEPTQFLLQFADALQPVDEPVPIEGDLSSF